MSNGLGQPRCAGHAVVHTRHTSSTHPAGARCREARRKIKAHEVWLTPCGCRADARMAGPTVRRFGGSCSCAHHPLPSSEEFRPRSQGVGAAGTPGGDLAEELQGGCPAYFKQDDKTYYEASELLQRAGSAAGAEQGHLLRQAVDLMLKVLAVFRA